VRLVSSAPVDQCAYFAPVYQCADYGGLWAKHKTPFLTFFRVWLDTYCQAYKNSKNVVLIDPRGFHNGIAANIAPIQRANGIRIF